MNFIRIFSQELLIENLAIDFAKKTGLIVNFNVLHNLGIPILKETINYYNKNNIVVVDCADSLSYGIYAIENNLPYIIISCLNAHVYNQIYNLGKQHNSKIFASEEKLFEYFANSH